MNFDARVRLEFVGSKLTSDAGLLVYRELEERLGLMAAADQFRTEQRTGRNVRYDLVALLRQWIFSRLAGYPDTNDGDRPTRGFHWPGSAVTPGVEPWGQFKPYGAS